jgi:hypothetical protein
MKGRQMTPNAIFYSASGLFAVEIKREDEKTKLIATVTYSKDKIGLLPIDCNLSDNYDRVAKFLADN